MVYKKQMTVDTSTYGSELVAARIGTEMVNEVRYKLGMLGISLEKFLQCNKAELTTIANKAIQAIKYKLYLDNTF